MSSQWGRDLRPEDIKILSIPEPDGDGQSRRVRARAQPNRLIDKMLQQVQRGSGEVLVGQVVGSVLLTTWHSDRL